MLSEQACQDQQDIYSKSEGRTNPGTPFESIHFMNTDEIVEGDSK